MVPAGKISVDPTARELDRLIERTPELAEAAAFHRAAVPLLRRYRRSVPPLAIEQNAVLRKLETGLPLLAGEALPFDQKAARTLFLDLCKIVERRGDPSFEERNPREVTPVVPANGKARSTRPLDAFSLWKRAQDGDEESLRAAAARQIRRALARGDLDISNVWEMVAGGDWRRLELTATGLKLDAELLKALARQCLMPAFQRWSQELQQKVDFTRWRRGYCPVCGSAPSFSEIQEKEGARRLRCGLCGAGWRYPHLKCAFCQNDDYKRLSNLSVEGEEEQYKVQACEACRGYIKIIKTYEPIPVDLLVVQDLATLHLDLIAAEHGYLR
jgi:FdhE protein